jgi:PD-(D/E)XK nuclease superfamily protein
VDRPSRAETESRRLINRRQQGDLGEASAIEWLAGIGATVLIPFGHSPDFDLAAEIEGRLARVQVKTSTQETVTPDGHPRATVSLVTRGGNQSWTGLVKRVDPARFELLFVLAGDGRRWLIPSEAIEGRNSITLGGMKYSEFEIEPGRAIRDLVYGEASSLESNSPQGEYPSGQRTAAVNRQAQPSQVRILPPPSSPASPDAAGADVTKFERKLGRRGQAMVRQKRQTTIPKRPFLDAGLRIGDRIRVRADGEGRLVFERIERPSPQLEEHPPPP